MANINVRIYEDNAGGIHAVVRTGGQITNFFTGLEFEYTHENHLTGADLIEAAQGGFEYADDYDPDSFDGLSLEEIAATVEDVDGYELIAEITSEAVELHFDRMGAEGHYLFGREEDAE